MRRIYWAVRREVWENRSIFILLLVVAALAVLAYTVTLVHLPARLRKGAALDPMQLRHLIAQPYDFVAAVIMGTQILVSAFYCLEAFYSERRDRSTLFWKSLPVSDGATVAAKASIPFLVVPLFSCAVTVAAEAMMLLLSSAVVAASGQSAGVMWKEVSLAQTSLLLLYHVFTTHVLWYAPLYGWLLLVSAWAPRAPFLWAFVPPVAVCYLEKIVFNSRHLVSLLEQRLLGGGMEAITPEGAFPTHPMTQLTPGRFLMSGGVWVGLALTAVFLIAAARLRRYRGAS
jgi:ABC-2 type transport system permease protein